MGQSGQYVLAMSLSFGLSFCPIVSITKAIEHKKINPDGYQVSNFYFFVRNSDGYKNQTIFCFEVDSSSFMYIFASV